MKRLSLAALAATAAFAFSASAANATVFAGHWFLENLKVNDPGLVLAATAYTGAFASEDLGPSDGNFLNGNEETDTVGLFGLYTTENSIDGDDIAYTGTATLRFEFDISPLPNDGPTTFTGVTGGLILPFIFRGGYLDWNPGNLLQTNNSMQLNFGPNNDGVMTITVNGGVFNKSSNMLPVAATFDWDHAASGAPEPAAWALMIAGFGLAGATLRRRRAITA